MGTVTIKSGPRAGTQINTEDASTASPGKHLVNGKWQTPMETADDEDANTASNAGMQAQSSDSSNKYQ
jgi:hypothetical protein